MSKGCERCGGSGVVFTTSLLGRGDKDTCPECGGRGIVESVTQEINAGIELRQENARLHKIIDDATGHSKDGDGVDLLCKALYGRPGQVPDWLGGSEARMLYDAVEEIEELRAEANALDRLRAWAAQDEHRDYSITIDSSDYMLHLGRGSDIDNDRLDSEWWILVSGNGDGVPSDECVVLGTPDSPASFAEMVDAALERWADLYSEQQ